MSDTEQTEHQGAALETDIWLSFKEASAEAPCCGATIKRAIKRGDLTGRKADTGHNASYDISKASFDQWLATRSEPKGKTPKLPESGGALIEKTPPAAESPDVEVTASTPTDTGAKPQLTKAARSKLKAARKKEIPESVRRLRRWKNFMRHATQEQALAMIKWLSGRLAPTKTLQKKILKEAGQERIPRVPTNNKRKASKPKATKRK